IGGNDVGAGERLLEEVKKHLLPQFGLRVSVLLDSNGANTTAAAAIHVAAQHLTLEGAPALVLGGTGPVGQRVSRLLAGEGAHVRVGSRQLARAAAVCDAIRAKNSAASLEPVSIASEAESQAAADGRELVVAAGAAGVTLLPTRVRERSKAL